MKTQNPILFVNEDQLFCDFFKIIIEPLNFVLHVVPSFKEARKAIKDNTYNGYIIATELPDGSGLDLIKFIRKNKNEIPIAIISAEIFHDFKKFSRLKEKFNINYVIEKEILSNEAQRLLMQFYKQRVSA